MVREARVDPARRMFEEYEPDICDARLERGDQDIVGRVTLWRRWAGGIDGCVAIRTTGIQVWIFTSVGLKLAKARTEGGIAPSALTGAVKWPAVTITRSRISVPLTNARSCKGRPASSTR